MPRRLGDRGENPLPYIVLPCVSGSFGSAWCGGCQVGMKVLKGISLLFAAVIGIALIAHGTSNLNNQPSAPVSPSVKPANIQGQPQRGPPDSFRGLKWDSALPNFKRLRETALKGCVAIVEEENLNDTRPCTHSHTDTDDMDMFIQRQNVSPIFDVPVSEQLVTWSHKKFWAGSAFIYGYRESDWQSCEQR